MTSPNVRGRRPTATRRSPVDARSRRRLADVAPSWNLGADRLAAGRRARPSSRRPRRAGPPPHRRGQAAVAVGRGDRRRRRSPSSPGPAPTRRAARRRSPSCASRTGSAARSTTCARSAPPSRCRSWPRSSSSTRGSSTSSALPGADARAAAGGPPSAGAPRAARRPARATSGLEPLVEAHDDARARGALRRRARLIGINNRDLRTLEVDPERAVRLRDGCPTTGSSSPSRASATPTTVARWRATGFDAALVGEALMRSRTRRRRPARSSRPAPSRATPRPWPGCPREDLRHHRRERDRSPPSAPAPTPIGLNVVARDAACALLDEGDRARRAVGASGPPTLPRIVAVTVGPDPRTSARSSPRSIPTRSS